MHPHSSPLNAREHSAGKALLLQNGQLSRRDCCGLIFKNLDHRTLQDDMCLVDRKLESEFIYRFYVMLMETA